MEAHLWGGGLAIGKRGKGVVREQVAMLRRGREVISEKGTGSDWNGFGKARRHGQEEKEELRWEQREFWQFWFYWPY
jgi:hypothetical protein